MRAFSVLTACVATIVAACSSPALARQITPAIALHGPPPAPSDMSRMLLLAPRPSISCDGASMEPVKAFDFPPLAGAAPVTEPAVTAFSIDQDGHPRDITGGAQANQAVLAGLRFPAEARSGCRLSLSYDATPLKQAPLDLLARYYAVARAGGPIREAVQARLASPGRDCRGLRPPRTVSYPDFRKGATPPGGLDWTIVSWNIDADGRAADVETLASSGEAEFDAETRRAVSETVVQAGEPLTGCVHNFFRRGQTLPAPPREPGSDDMLADCPEAVARRFQPGVQTYPAAFRQRGIEGWARVRFDLASWGAIGAVHVLEAQPASAFGEAARNVVVTGRAEPGFEGAVRCVAPIVFRMPAEESAPPGE